MRHLPKPAGTAAEACILEFIGNQMRAREEGAAWETVKVDYGSFTRTAQLRGLLIQEQKGLCAYTGAALDGRLALRRPGLQIPPRTDYWFKPHIEHLKPEEQCRKELEERGGTVGKDVGEDMEYPNMVAAIEVAGTSLECFGASFRGTKALPVIPTMPDCERRFEYLESGRVVGLTDEAEETIANLRLDHPTLEDWRRGAIQAFLAKAPEMTNAELAALSNLHRPEDGTLEEFAFVVAPFARFISATRETL